MTGEGHSGMEEIGRVLGLGLGHKARYMPGTSDVVPSPQEVPISIYGNYKDEPLEWPDILIIAVYFAIVIAVGIGSSCRATTTTAAGYFLAGRSMSWIPIGASTFSTNIGAPMFIGVAGSAAASGYAIVMFEWHAMFMLIALGWIFLPVYLSTGCYTMPQYLKMRFGGQRIRVWLTLINQLIIIVSSISGQMYAGILFITEVLKWEVYSSICIILAITAVYTIIGGLTAVIWTDTIQTVILVGGAFVLAILSVIEIGGYQTITEQFLKSASHDTYLNEALYGNLTCGFPSPRSFHIFRPVTDGDYPWTGMIFGLTILATDAWCTNQVCVQRSLSAKTLTHAKGGVILAAYLKFLPFIFFAVPGMISRILFPDEIGCSSPERCEAVCGNTAGCTNVAYPLLVNRVLPIGVKGLMMAALLSALMSSLTSTFNSSTTLFTMDLYRRCRSKAKTKELMIVSRLWTVALAGITVAWLPALDILQGAKFWDYIQSIASYILPPVVMVFLFGIFWTRTTEVGAFSSMVIGLAIGIVRMGLEWSKSGTDCGGTTEDTRFDVVANVHYLHFAVILGLCCSAVIVVVSIMTKPRTKEQLHRVTWWTKHHTEFPDLTEDEDSDIDNIDDEEYERKRITDPQEESCYKSNVFMEKWFCGFDRSAPRPKKRTSAEKEQYLRDLTNITEDPEYKKMMDFQAILCAASCVFIHCFFY